jgi:adenylylsulfate kinase-like enzyme
VSGRREYGGERAEAGTGMNRNKPELNRKSTTLLTMTGLSIGRGESTVAKVLKL